MERIDRTAYVGIAALLVACACLPAQATERDHAPATRVERLAGLAKAWGSVRYLHPAFACRPVDWDRALVDAIAPVEAAQSQAAYVAALNRMLATLDDPVTRVAPLQPASDTPAPVAEASQAVTFESDRLRLDAPAAARLVAMHGAAAQDAALESIREAAPTAKRVIIDLRRQGAADPESAYQEKAFLEQALALLVDRDIQLPALRYRVHDGYAPQSGTSSDGYTSTLATEVPQHLQSLRKERALPIAVIVNGDTATAAFAAALRSAGAGVIVQQGRAPRFTDIRRLRPAPGLELTLSVADLVTADGASAFTADAVVAGDADAIDAANRLLAHPALQTAPKPAPACIPGSEHDRPYADMALPSREYRLLALFRDWNVIDRFYPYKELVGQDWDEVLARYIPRFEAAATVVDYQRAALQLSMELHDSHGFVRGIDALQESLGLFVPPVVAQDIAGQTVVTRLLDDSHALHVGEVVTEVDGIPIAQLRERWAALTPASTPQALAVSMHRQLLRGARGTSARLRVRGLDGQVREVALPRSLGYRDPAYLGGSKRTGPVVRTLRGGIVYVDLDRLLPAEVDAMFERLQGAPAVILDMRGYPNGTAWPIAPRLASARGPVAAQFSRNIVSASGSEDELQSRHVFLQTIPDAQGAPYAGRVVMLVNGQSISQAEHTGLFLEAATKVAFIGSPTAGANGDATNVVLPGGIVMHFSGHSVRHADGRQLQRLGLQPDVPVEPTIAGVAAGRDEVLEAAVDYLSK